ncbi:M28 family peptidase [Gordonia insulae]|uniref:M28 family peptidase n=1 Tax=Gordonia insulae TaxID=2420509 RepID=UPI001E46A961|nr:M28 family peptidase [Gordonia insulae]
MTGAQRHVDDRRAHAVLSLVLAFAVAACAGTDPTADRTSSSPAGPTVATSLTPDGLAAAVTLDNVMGHVRALQSIAERHNGNRASGTAGYDASVDYVAGRLTDAGFSVTTPTFDYPRFESGPLTLTADGRPVEATVVQYSAGTGGRPLTGGPVAITGHGCAPADYPPTTSGAIAVVDRGTCTFAAKARAAADAGARAVVVVNTSPDALTGATLGVDSAAAIPVVGVAQASGPGLRDAGALTLNLTAETRTITSRNVIAQTRTGAVDDVVVAGAHLDSVADGPGMNDNATGTAAVLETALRLGSSPRVENAVRFTFWGAEEDGLVGSSRYVSGLDDEQRRTIGRYLNFDMLGSPNPGYFVYDGDDSESRGAGPGPAGSDQIERVFTEYYDGRRIPTRPADFTGRSDYGPFLEIGVPAGGILTGAEEKKSAEQATLWGGRADAPFDPNYHRRGDTVDNVDRVALGINSSAVGYAVGTWALAMDHTRARGNSPASTAPS